MISTHTRSKVIATHTYTFAKTGVSRIAPLVFGQSDMSRNNAQRLLADYVGDAGQAAALHVPSKVRQVGENMSRRTIGPLEIQAATLLREAINATVASVEEPELRRVVSEIAAEINGNLYLLSLTAREHD